MLSDPNGNQLTAIHYSGPGSGTLVLNADGSFIYTPNSDYVGSDSFTYKANDGEDDSGETTVTLAVEPTNHAPVAEGYSVDENSMLTVPTASGVLANNSDADNDPLTAVLVSGPTYGSVTLNADCSFT
jgi:VCBS repeat-containing protein